MKKFTKFKRISLKLRTYAPKTYVDEKKNLVVTVIDYQAILPRPITNIMEGLYFYGWIDGKRMTGGDVTGTARGYATVAPGDTFDVEKGKRISRAKAERNAYLNAVKSLRKRLADLQDVLGEFYSQIREFDRKANGVAEHNERYIDRIADGE